MAGNWVEITVHITPEILEELSPQFFALGCQGINELDLAFQLFFTEQDWNKETHKKLQDQLKSKTEDVANCITVKEIKSENWNENWKENFKTFRVGQSVIIKPDWESYIAGPGEIVITITPKMAFGTGHHETTQLILSMLEEYLQPGMSVMDAGTGSAILAIYAAMKGAEAVMAYDNDPEAMENAHENVQLNNVADKIDLHCGELADFPVKEHDVILANINRNVLMQLSEPLKPYSKKGGMLILSGLLITDYEDILSKYSGCGWKLKNSKQQGEWMSVLFENK